MFIVYYNNDNSLGKILRPSPLVSIGFNAKRNKSGYLGGDYSITLNGTILASGGSPIANIDSSSLPDKLLAKGPNFVDDIATNPQFKYAKPTEASVSGNLRSHAILLKQQAIRALFARDGQKMEISPITNDSPCITFYPIVDSVNFEDGIYFDQCKYTINLSAPVLYGSGNKPLLDSFTLLRGEDKRFDKTTPIFYSGIIEDFSDTWSIEADEAFFSRVSSNMDSRNIPRAYRLTRNISATGKTAYYPESNVSDAAIKRYDSWESARKFIKEILLNEDSINVQNSSKYFPYASGTGKFGYGLLDVSGQYGSYNHVRTENIDVSNGSYSITDTWLLTSGINNVIENYDISLSSSTDSPIINVTLNGQIQGLSSLTSDNNRHVVPFNNAMLEYYRLSNNQNFGINSNFYKRANAITIIGLNPFPASHTANINKAAGTIDYQITFDNRPLTFFSNVISENIQVTDTYPGDVYAMLPVLNRSTGPLFQYLGGITLYERSLNIDFIVDLGILQDQSQVLKNKIVYLTKCPSRNPTMPIAEELQKLILSFSPSGEPNIRKYLINPITENWEPRTGKYSVGISWVYELNQ